MSLDRTLLDLSSKMAEPICIAWHLLRFRLVSPLDPRKFENCSTVGKEIATRTFIVLGAVFLVASMPLRVIGGVTLLGGGSKLLRAIGFALQKGGFTHARGQASEIALDRKNPKVKLMSWNLCGVGGGMSLDHGGVVSWRSRLDAIVDKIKSEDPDVLILQEIYDTALAEALIERLQLDYAHFFTHLGPSVWGMVCGVMVVSKCAVHKFSHTSFENNDWTLNRGFADLELKAAPRDSSSCIKVIGTHLIHGNEAQDKRNRALQVAHILRSVAHRTLPIVPTVLAGDLNIERDQEEGAQLSSRLLHGYKGSEPTSTNRLEAQWDCKAKSAWGETIDYISLFKRSDAAIEDCHLVKAFDDTYNTKMALSDHHGVSATVRLNEKRTI